MNRVDYKFFCFDGVVRIVSVELGVALPDGGHNPYSTRNIYNRDFEYLDVRLGRDHFDKTLVSKPKNFDKMIEYAEVLSQLFPHCRVDLYNIDGKIFFGELTFYHGGATQKIEPKEWEKRLGDWIDLNSEKIKHKDEH